MIAALNAVPHELYFGLWERRKVLNDFLDEVNFDVGGYEGKSAKLLDYGRAKVSHLLRHAVFGAHNN